MMEQPFAIVATDGIADFAKRVYDNIQKLDNEHFAYRSVKRTVFANGEIKPVIEKSVRKKDVYLFHALHPDPNTSYLELFLTIDALSRASAQSIHLMLPYMPYQRQDRKDEPHAPISASVMAALTQANRAVSRLSTMDMHAPQIEGCYQIPVDNLVAGTTVHKEYWRNKFNGDYSNLLIVSPDHGGTTRSRKFAKSLDDSIPLGMIDKRRTGPNKAEVLNYIGPDPAGKQVILYDDLIDTGGSIIAAAKSMRDRGASNVYVCATHAVFSKTDKPTEDRFREAGLEVVVTESIPRPQSYLDENKDWLTVLSLDRLFAGAVYESSTGGSISSLLEKY